MKINLEEMLKYPKVFETATASDRKLCEYNNLKYMGAYATSIPRDELKCIRIPYDVNDLLQGEGLIGYTDGEILLIGFTYGVQVYIKNPD